MTVLSNSVCEGDGGPVLSRNYAMAGRALCGDGRGMIVPAHLAASGGMVTTSRGESEGKWAI
jgi:hypothetical protein